MIELKENEEKDKRKKDKSCKELKIQEALGRKIDIELHADRATFW